MPVTLSQALEVLHTHQRDLRELGVQHAAIFGSVARGDAGGESDVDVLVELDPRKPMGVFEYARLKIHIGELISGAEVVNRKMLKPMLRDSILRESVNAF